MGSFTTILKQESQPSAVQRIWEALQCNLLESHDDDNAIALYTISRRCGRHQTSANFQELFLPSNDIRANKLQRSLDYLNGGNADCGQGFSGDTPCQFQASSCTSDKFLADFRVLMVIGSELSLRKFSKGMLV